MGDRHHERKVIADRDACSLGSSPGLLIPYNRNETPGFDEF
jgi:hypothetical protein